MKVQSEVDRKDIASISADFIVKDISRENAGWSHSNKDQRQEERSPDDDALDV